MEECAVPVPMRDSRGCELIEIADGIGSPRGFSSEHFERECADWRREVRVELPEVRKGLKLERAEWIFRVKKPEVGVRDSEFRVRDEPSGLEFTGFRCR
jgi:hypothetical protein